MCALVPLSLVAPLDVKAGHDQALALETSLAGLFKLRQASDLIRVAWESDRLESTMVCVAREQVSETNIITKSASQSEQELS